MHKVVQLVAVVVTATILAAGFNVASTGAARADEVNNAPAVTRFEHKVLHRINQIRVQQGLKRLHLDTCLAQDGSARMTTPKLVATARRCRVAWLALVTEHTSRTPAHLVRRMLAEHRQLLLQRHLSGAGLTARYTSTGVSVSLVLA